MKLQLDSLLQQKMTRKQFLQYIGSVLLVLLGISSVIKALQSGVSPSSIKQLDYGSSVYGGE